jgi:hypothetical protein
MLTMFLGAPRCFLLYSCCLICACRIAEHQAEKNAPVDVSTAANLAMQLSYNNKNMLQAGLIIAGDGLVRGSSSSSSISSDLH